jgi:hypothetical protein
MYQACYLLHAGFLLGLFFYSEDGSDVLLRYVSWLSTIYTAEDRTFHNHRCENLEYYMF